MNHQSIDFITGNQHKWQEAQMAVKPEINLIQHDIPLLEIQSMKVFDVIKAKLEEAYSQRKHPLCCEDTGLYIETLGGFPGALIKHYLQAIGPKGICHHAAHSPAYAETVVGYHDGKQMHFFFGRIEGTIPSSPKGEGFGWSSAFIPKGMSCSFAEMSIDEKVAISMRTQAFKQLKSYFSTNA